jgi:hypothetical protein
MSHGGPYIGWKDHLHNAIVTCNLVLASRWRIPFILETIRQYILFLSASLYYQASWYHKVTTIHEGNAIYEGTQSRSSRKLVRSSFLVLTNPAFLHPTFAPTVIIAWNWIDTYLCCVKLAEQNYIINDMNIGSECCFY